MSIHPWQIAAGVAVGIVAGAVLMDQVGREPAQRAFSEAVESFNRLVDGKGRPVPRDEKERLRQAAEQAAAKTLGDQQARQLRADQQQAPGGGGSEALQAAARKERAWTKFYKKPEKCDGNPNDQTMTECANHYIRARREFEAAYAQGKL